VAAAALQGSGKDIAEIGRELAVGTILKGSVRRTGDRVRVTAQLIDTRTQAHLWAESYKRELEDLFRIQGDVAQQGDAVGLARARSRARLSRCRPMP
jgi:TolB-like protein